MTDSIVDVTQSLVDTITNSDLGFKDVFYGDEKLIPRTPAVSVIPDTKDRVLAETGMMVVNTFQVFIIIYHSRLDTVQVTRKECDALAEQLESLLHLDKKLGGLLYTSHATTLTPGYVTRGKVIMQATRITWQGRSKTRI